MTLVDETKKLLIEGIESARSERIAVQDLVRYVEWHLDALEKASATNKELFSAFEDLEIVNALILEGTLDPQSDKAKAWILESVDKLDRAMNQRPRYP